MKLTDYMRETQLTADDCIKCNICTSNCPVAAVTDKFPGPKVVGPQAQRFREPGERSVDRSVDYCSGCGTCTWAANGYRAPCCWTLPMCWSTSTSSA